jgi:hypothetical protein
MGVRTCVLDTPVFLTDGANLQPGLGDSRDEPGDDPMTNSSFFTADRTTHLKIVVVSLLASITVMMIGIAARPQVAVDAQQANVYNPAKAIVATSILLSEVR